MRNNIRSTLQFGVLLTVVIVIVLAGHLAVLFFNEQPLFDHKIESAYTFNYFFALVVFILLNFLKEKHADILGFIFMGGSLVKFGFFFVLFKPFYELDDEITVLEFATFFIPYSFCLMIEVYYLIKILNRD